MLSRGEERDRKLTVMVALMVSVKHLCFEVFEAYLLHSKLSLQYGKFQLARWSHEVVL